MKKTFEVVSLIGLACILVMSFVIPEKPFEWIQGINYDYPTFLFYFVGIGGLFLIVLWGIYSLLDLIVNGKKKPTIEKEVNSSSSIIIDENEDEEEEEVFEREDLGSTISYFELLELIEEGTNPLEVELILCKKKCRYIWDEENEYYIIKSREEEKEPFEYWLRDCLVDSQSFDKCIKIKR